MKFRPEADDRALARVAEKEVFNMPMQVTFEPPRMGKPRQLLHYLTPTKGLTTVGNHLARLKDTGPVTVTVKKNGLFVQGKKVADSWHLAGRLYYHGVQQFTLDDTNKYDLKAAFRSIIHRRSIESIAHKVARFGVDVKVNVELLPTLADESIAGIFANWHKEIIDFHYEEVQIKIPEGSPAAEHSYQLYWTNPDGTETKRVDNFGYLDSTIDNLIKSLKLRSAQSQENILRLLKQRNEELHTRIMERWDAVGQENAGLDVPIPPEKRLEMLSTASDDEVAKILAEWPTDIVEPEMILMTEQELMMKGDLRLEGLGMATKEGDDIPAYSDDLIDELIQALRFRSPDSQTRILEQLKLQNQELHDRILERWD